MEKGSYYITLENGDIKKVSKETKKFFLKLKSVHTLPTLRLLRSIEAAIHSNKYYKYYKYALWISYPDEYAVMYFEKKEDAIKEKETIKRPSNIKELKGNELIEANYSYFFLYPEEKSKLS